MKLFKLFQGGPKAAGSLLLVSSMSLFAADSTPAVPSDAPPPVMVAQPKLPYGVEDILKLSRAQVSEEVVVNFVQNSGTVYNLSSSDIVYLRHEGVSDRVITAMLEKRKKAIDAAQNESASSSSAPAPAVTPPQDTAATAPANPAPVYVQPPPQPSTVYVAPPPPVTYYPYGYYAPYYGPYYYGPRISLGFRFGGGWGGHHWHR